MVDGGPSVGSRFPVGEDFDEKRNGRVGMAIRRLELHVRAVSCKTVGSVSCTSNSLWKKL